MKKDNIYQPSKAELDKPISIDAMPEELARAVVRPQDLRGRRANKPLKVIAGAPDRPLIIGDIEIPCYVLEDRTRVLSQRGLLAGVGLGTGGRKKQIGAPRMAEFVGGLEDKGIKTNGLSARPQFSRSVSTSKWRENSLRLSCHALG